MKKILIAAALIFTTGILTSCSNKQNVSPVYYAVHKVLTGDKKNLASAD